MPVNARTDYIPIKSFNKHDFETKLKDKKSVGYIYHHRPHIYYDYDGNKCYRAVMKLEDNRHDEKN